MALTVITQTFSSLKISDTISMVYNNKVAKVLRGLIDFTTNFWISTMWQDCFPITDRITGIYNKYPVPWRKVLSTEKGLIQV